MLKHSRIHIVTGILALSLLVGCSNSGLPGDTVAKVNGDTITNSEFQDSYRKMVKQMNLPPVLMDNLDDNNNPMVIMVKKVTLQNMILQSLVEQEAQKRKIAITDKDVDALYQQYATRVGGGKALSAQLISHGMSKTAFKAELKEQLLKDKVAEALSANSIKVSESEARAFYEKNRKSYDTPEQVRARHILVAADPNQVREDYLKLNKDAKPDEVDKKVESAMAEKKQKATQLYEQVKLKPDAFADIARKNSDDTGSAKNGGDLGYFAKEVMVPTFSQAAFSTKPGEINEGLVESPFGYHIIQVVDRKAPESKTFEEVKADIIEFKQNKRKSDTLDSWLRKTKQQARITISPGYDFEKKLDEVKTREGEREQKEAKGKAATKSENEAAKQ